VRKRLKQIGSQERHTYRGKFVRSGFKNDWGHYHPTLLLRDIYDEQGEKVTDHLWFNYTLGFLRLGELMPDDQVSFSARVTTYEKGQRFARQLDVKLARPTKVRRLVVPTEQRRAMPLRDPHALIGYIMAANEAFYRANGRPFERFYVTAFKQWRQVKNG